MLYNHVMRLITFAAATLTLLALVCWATYRSAQLLKQVKVDFNLLLLPAENVLRLAIIGGCLALGVGSGLPPAALGWRPAQPVGDVVWSLGLGVITQLALNLASDWAVVRFGKGVYSPLVILSVLPHNRREWVLVSLALGPAVLLEELLFRSLLLGGFSLWVHPLLLAAALSVVFGLMHAPQGPLGVAATCLVGFELSLLFLWRGSLLAAFVAHYTINLLQLVWAHHRRQWLKDY